MDDIKTRIAIVQSMRDRLIEYESTGLDLEQVAHLLKENDKELREYKSKYPEYFI